jgi:cysteine desulfuration protein SufE|tara:strand:- start:2320 stop:2730 length:411 start_codon:yes stop_codon:yes gene_type:complete
MMIDKIQEMGENLKLLEGHDRLHYLIDKAKDIDPLPESAKTEDNRIRGCASKLWVIGGAKEDGTMMYQVDGDAHISKGTAKVVTDIVNGEHKSAVAGLTVESFTPLGIKELLTMQRQNGLGELIDRIIRIAQSYEN